VETKWLEDFVSLAETRSFSRSAQLRHVTQPAFSRRIQALEAWAGADLIDRSSYPTRLTPAGETFRAQALELLVLLQNTRNLMRNYKHGAQHLLEIAAPHTLAFTFFPQWLMKLRRHFGDLRSRVIAMNVHDAVLRLTEGNCDLLMTYHHPTQPLQLNAQRYEMLVLDQETLAPYVKAGPDGRPLYTLPGDRQRPVPFLGYAAGAYMGRLVEQILKLAPNAPSLDTIYETDMSEGLRVMALEGHGVAFLPTSAVRKDVEARRLVSAAPGDEFIMQMDVRIYRERPEVARHVKPASQELWAFLELQQSMQAATPSASPSTPAAANEDHGAEPAMTRSPD